MHNHPLHTRVNVKCECCAVPREFEFTSSSDHIICKGCRRHIGDSNAKIALRAADHAGLYWSELMLSIDARRTDERHFEIELDKIKQQVILRDTVIARKDVTISDLQATVRSGELNPAVEQWLADGEVQTALRRRDNAYPARDYALAALWQIARIHYPDDHADDRCVCGRSARHCAELIAIAPELAALKDWEEKQIQRLRSGHDHGLPDNHPEVQKAGWPARRRPRLA